MIYKIILAYCLLLFSVAVYCQDTPTPGPTPSETPSETPSGTSSAAATQTSTANSMEDCRVASHFSTTDFFPNKIDYRSLVDARFNVTYHNTYKIIQNRALDENYILYCTDTPPDLQVMSKTYIQIPVNTLAVFDTRALGFLDLLGLSNNVSYVGNTNNVTSPCRMGQPYSIEGDSVESSRYDLAVYSGTVSNNPKGVGFGIGYDNTPLGNAQWVKYFSFFTNQEVQADAIYNTIQSDYEYYRNGVNGCNISYKRNLTYMDFDRTTNRYNVFQDRYFRNLTLDAGGVFLSASVAQPAHYSVMMDQLQNASLLMDFTSFQAFDEGGYEGWLSWMGYDAALVEKGATDALSAYKLTRQYINSVNAPPFVRNNQLWRFDFLTNRGALDFWTRGLARPDLMLKDLIQAQFSGIFETERWSFLRNYAQDDVSEVSVTGTTTTEGYGCTADSAQRVNFVENYINQDSDAPDPRISETEHQQISKAVTIAVGVIGGLIGLSCIVSIAILAARKYKDKHAQRFIPLNDELESAPENRQPLIPGMSEHSSSTSRTVTSHTIKVSSSTVEKTS